MRRRQHPHHPARRADHLPRHRRPTRPTRRTRPPPTHPPRPHRLANRRRPPPPRPHGITTSLDEATGALDLAAKLGFTTPVLHAADLLVFPVLLRDRDAITDLVTTVLGPLATARGGPQPLLDTLTALFDNQGNHTATARQLHLSVRAVTYRLDRIHTLTGYHPGEPTQRFTLQTAVLGARLLGWSAKAAPH
ncbi:PucR family transcriptional regulator [Phytohabitans rumicis]|uniref:PucR family transcriptional regulator n=1 Tax=Phytohabitans rumicis TaxID=1076125 RepID=UPI00280B3030|nr:helix-turn-helix domain-containing protein [Phytohabitans rumicis]